MTSVEPAPQAIAPQPAGTFPNAWTLFRVRGVPVKLDRSWLLIAAFVIYLFFGRLTESLPAAGPVEVALLAAIGAVLFFASILAHELGHALTSLDRDIPVLSITLFAMGGVTESTREATRARDEFVIVGIGPFISLVLAGAFGLLATVSTAIPPLAMVAGYLGWTNLALAIFNIVPGYPLDGGRLLRSIIWGATGRPHQATRWAARVGQAFAALLITYGAVGFAAGGGGGDLWNVFIGFFLFRGATTSHRRAQLRERVLRRTVRDVMGSVPQPLSPTATVRDALEQVQERPSLLWPVGDPVQGTLLMASIDAVAAEDWDTARVSDIAFDASLSTVGVDADLDSAIDLMVNSPDNMLVVVDAGHPVGLLTPSLVTDIAH